MRPRSVLLTFTQNRNLCEKCEKSTKRLSKYLSKSFQKPSKINPKLKNVGKKNQDDIRCVQNAPKMHKIAKNGPKTSPKSRWPPRQPGLPPSHRQLKAIAFKLLLLRRPNGKNSASKLASVITIQVLPVIPFKFFIEASMHATPGAGQ